MGVEAPGKGSQDWTISLFLGASTPPTQNICNTPAFALKTEGACWMKGLRRDVFCLNKSSFFLFKKLKGLPG